MPLCAWMLCGCGRVDVASELGIFAKVLRLGKVVVVVAVFIQDNNDTPYEANAICR